MVSDIKYLYTNCYFHTCLKSPRAITALFCSLLVYTGTFTSRELDGQFILICCTSPETALSLRGGAVVESPGDGVAEGGGSSRVRSQSTGQWRSRWADCKCCILSLSAGTFSRQPWTHPYKCVAVHNALQQILEPRFSAETLALLLNIPPQKTLLRRHLATAFSTLVGHQAAQEKREYGNATGHMPLTTTAKVKVREQPSIKMFQRLKRH